MADPEYIKALKAGQRAQRMAVLRGEYPYLPALDEFLPASQIQTETPMGLMDIPLDQIVGTKTAGRQQAFANNFMPLMNEKSEFASKWSNLYKYQLEEGVKDPIICYEYMNKYYVLEGNKRVSVFKYLNAFSIEGNVTRIVPKMSNDPQVKIFYEYMEFYRKTGINYVWFTKEGGFETLFRQCGGTAENAWTDQQKEDFSSNYLRFSKLFAEKGGKKLDITAGDAFVFYLGIYDYAALPEKTDAQIKKEMDKLWKEFDAIEEEPTQALVLQPAEGAEAGMFTRFFTGTGSKKLKVAFIHDKPVEGSGWVYSHELGKNYLENVFGDRIEATSYFLESETGNKQGVMEAAIEDGNHIIFATSERFLDTSLKCALEHPEVKILNCCINRPYQSIRTYYGRMYEAKFLEGIIAGAMAENDKIAYEADYPIYGSLANINAFALGARMTNPRAKVYLHWSSMVGEDLETMAKKHDIRVISDLDSIRPGSAHRRYGLYKIGEEKIENLAAPMWNWGKFYEKIIRDILAGSWNSQEAKGRKAVNYWWGISGDIIDLVTSLNLPSGVNSLVHLLRDQIYQDNLHPFDGKLIRQDGEVAADGSKPLRAEQILQMDWLCENVIGHVPTLEELTEDGKSLVMLQGVTSAVEGA